jgi:hypothetical protein
MTVFVKIAKNIIIKKPGEARPPVLEARRAVSIRSSTKD